MIQTPKKELDKKNMQPIQYNTLSIDQIDVKTSVYKTHYDTLSEKQLSIGLWAPIFEVFTQVVASRWIFIFETKLKENEISDLKIRLNNASRPYNRQNSTKSKSRSDIKLEIKSEYGSSEQSDRKMPQDSIFTLVEDKDNLFVYEFRFKNNKRKEFHSFKTCIPLEILQTTAILPITSDTTALKESSTNKELDFGRWRLDFQANNTLCDVQQSNKEWRESICNLGRINDLLKSRYTTIWNHLIDISKNFLLYHFTQNQLDATLCQRLSQNTNEPIQNDGKELLSLVFLKQAENSLLYFGLLDAQTSIYSFYTI
jgi:hypothetical protein